MLILFMSLLCWISTEVVGQPLPGSRLGGMGNNGIALSDDWVIHSNPAGPDPSQGVRLMTLLEINSFAPEVKRQGVVIHVPVRQELISFFSEVQGMSLYRKWIAGVNLAKSFGHHFSLGLRFQLNGLQMEVYGNETAFSSDGGFRYQLSPQWSLGGTIHLRRLADKRSGQLYKPHFRTGAAFALHPKLLFAGDIYVSLDSFRPGIGLEYRLNESIRFRTGRQLGSSELYAGLGMQFSSITVDLALQNQWQTTYFPQFTLSYAF